MNTNKTLQNLIKAALVDFKRNKVRTLLTSLGIMIGVFSVVLLIALGLGLKNYLREQFDNLGANLITIMPGNGIGSGPSSLIGGTEFDERDLTSLKKIREAEYIVPTYFSNATIDANGQEYSGSIMGINAEGFALWNLEVIYGKQFSDNDGATRAKKAVLGGSIAEELYDDIEDAIGKTIKFKDQRFKVIGVIDKIGDPQLDNSAIIPHETTYSGINPDKNFFNISIGVEDKKDIETVKARAKDILMERYKEDDFSVLEQSEILSTVDQIFGVVNAILIAIGSISLVVGGIGIMNIMYATVTERTKEVGVRRALGATESEILNQFLVESVVLSITGGILGLLMATIIVLITRQFFPAEINFTSVALALGISTAIGVFFGVFPARRAAKLPPIEAIRYE